MCIAHGSTHQNKRSFPLCFSHQEASLRQTENPIKVSDSCEPTDCSTPGFPAHQQLGVYSNSCPQCQWCHSTISSSVNCSPNMFNHSQYQGLFQWVSSSHQVAKVLKLHLQQQYFKWIFRTDMLEDWLLWSPCSPKDSQESSPTPQFKSINSSVLSCLYSPTLISIHDYWKNHSFD